jgi:hypothetical protein
VRDVLSLVRNSKMDLERHMRNCKSRPKEPAAGAGAAVGGGRSAVLTLKRGG